MSGGGGDTAGRGQPQAPAFHLNQCSVGSSQAHIHTGVESGPSDQAQRETGRQQLKEAWAWENAAEARPGNKGGQVSTAAGALPEACRAGERETECVCVRETDRESMSACECVDV